MGTSEANSPQDIAFELFREIDPDAYEEVLLKVLPAYVRHWLAERRRWRAEPKVEALEEETFAPDDLLSDEGQVVQEVKKTRMLQARGSSRVNAMRTEWQRHFKDRVWNGERYMEFGDMNAKDLIGAANALRKQADSMTGKAAYYEKIAEAVAVQNVLVQDLTDDPTRD